MDIDFRIKKILLSSEFSSHNTVKSLLDVFNVSIEEVILSIDKSDSEEAWQWLENYMVGRQEEEYDFTISDKSFNHLYSLVECEQKDNLYNYHLSLDYIKILNTDNINKLQESTKKVPEFQVQFFINLFNSNENYKLIEKSFILELIELMGNKNLTKAIDNDLKVPKIYLEKTLNSLTLDGAFTLMRRKRSSSVLELFKSHCTAHKTTFCGYLTQCIKRKNPGICSIHPGNWRWIMEGESAHDLKPVFEALAKQKNHNFWGVTKEVLDMWNTKIIIEEKNQLLSEIKEKTKKTRVVKL